MNRAGPAGDDREPQAALRRAAAICHPDDHLPDGDNWGDADNRLSRDLVLQVLPLVDLFGYVEVRPHGRSSGLGTVLHEIQDPRFHSLRVTDRQSVLGALDALFGQNAS